MTTDRTSGGDRLWSEAATAALSEFTTEVRKRAKDIDQKVEVDPVHDMRTATRRLRTAIELYGQEAAKDDRDAVEDELRRVARRLGSVRDLDVLLESLEAATTDGNGRLEPDGVDPLRQAWTDERAAGAKRLRAEIDRARFGRALDGAEQLWKPADEGSGAGPHNGGRTDRISHRAPGLIWASFGEVLAYEIDPLEADPAVIHEMRIAAKKLRYTLEAFEDALQPGATLIEQVTALQDAGGEMHDAIVARDRARETIKTTANLGKPERTAIEAYAKTQDDRSEAQRPVTARCLATIRSRAFRDSLSRAVTRMGHVQPVS